MIAQVENESYMNFIPIFHLFVNSRLTFPSLVRFSGKCTFSAQRSQSPINRSQLYTQNNCTHTT